MPRRRWLEAAVRVAGAFLDGGVGYAG